MSRVGRVVAGGIAAVLAGCATSTSATHTSVTATIFKLAGRQIRQVTIQGQAVRLAVNGSVTHQDGFRCDGTQLVTVHEGVARNYTTWTYERDTYTWEGSTLVLGSKQTGQVSSAQPGSPPAAYSEVSCGDLP